MSLSDVPLDIYRIIFSFLPKDELTFSVCTEFADAWLLNLVDELQHHVEEKTAVGKLLFAYFLADGISDPCRIPEVILKRIALICGDEMHQSLSRFQPEELIKRLEVCWEQCDCIGSRTLSLALHCLSGKEREHIFQYVRHGEESGEPVDCDGYQTELDDEPLNFHKIVKHRPNETTFFVTTDYYRKRGKNVTVVRNDRESDIVRQGLRWTPLMRETIIKILAQSECARTYIVGLLATFDILRQEISSDDSDESEGEIEDESEGEIADEEEEGEDAVPVFWIDTRRQQQVPFINRIITKQLSTYYMSCGSHDMPGKKYCGECDRYVGEYCERCREWPEKFPSHTPPSSPGSLTFFSSICGGFISANNLFFLPQDEALKPDLPKKVRQPWDYEDDSDLLTDKSKWYNEPYPYEPDQATAADSDVDEEDWYRAPRKKGCRYPCCSSCVTYCDMCGHSYCCRCTDDHFGEDRCVWECHCCREWCDMTTMTLCTRIVKPLYGQFQKRVVGCGLPTCKKCIRKCKGCEYSVRHMCCVDCLLECVECHQKFACNHGYTKLGHKICVDCWWKDDTRRRQTSWADQASLEHCGDVHEDSSNEKNTDLSDEEEDDSSDDISE